MPFYNVGGSSSCQLPSDVKTYPKFKNIGDSDYTTCDVVGGGSVLVQPINDNFRQPDIFVTGNSSCSPSYGLSVQVEPVCPSGQTCPDVQCFPGVAETITVQGDQLHKCQYSCKNLTKVHLNRIIIRADLNVKLCDVTIAS